MSFSIFPVLKGLMKNLKSFLISIFGYCHDLLLATRNKEQMYEKPKPKRFSLKLKNNLTLKFLQFKLVNRHLHNSLIYKKSQIKLLEEKIRAKWKRTKILEKDTKNVREELQGTLHCLDFSLKMAVYPF